MRRRNIWTVRYHLKLNTFRKRDFIYKKFSRKIRTCKKVELVSVDGLVWGWEERERERERERETDRQTDRQTDRARQRLRQRQKERDRD